MTNKRLGLLILATLALSMPVSLPVAAQAAPQAPPPVDPAPRSVQESLPTLGDASSAIVSPENERRLGEYVLRSLRSTLPTYDDALIKYYTEFLLYRLAEHSDLNAPRLSVMIIDSPQLNAFAAPGGIVGINLGLFVEAPTVNEFSSVLAHELAHLSQRHYARGVEKSKRQALPTIASLVVGIALAATVGTDAGLAALASSQGLMEGSQLRYSREREREADRLGIDTLARAGMDPRAMASMFDHMQDTYRYVSRPPEFLLTHPVTQSRVADARNQAAHYPVRTFRDSLDFHLVRARIRTHYAKTPADALRLFEGEVATGRTDHLAASKYGLALTLGKLQRQTEGLTVLEPLYRAEPGRLAYLITWSDLQYHAGNTTDALALLRRQLAVNPDNLPIAMQLAALLNKQSQHEQAEALLRRQSAVRPDDDDIWYQLAETAGLAGNTIGVHRARAEYFQLNGNLGSAIQHMEYALQLLPPNDFGRLARFQQRAEELRALGRSGS